MGCGASSEAAPPVPEKPVAEKNETADRVAPAAEANEPAGQGISGGDSTVPDSVKKGSASVSGLLERGYDDQFIHPLASAPVPWSDQLVNSASAGS